MSKKTYKVTSKVWEYPGMSGWFFANVDKKQSAVLKESFGKKAGGFGSIKVGVTLGKTKWKTSIFPEKQSATYLLPLKAAVRRAEGIDKGDSIKFTLDIQ